MQNDAQDSLGNDGSEEPRPPRDHDRNLADDERGAASDSELVRSGRAQASMLAASKFVGRVSQLDAAALQAVVTAWHDAMRADSDAWFAAERATAYAVAASGRQAEQEFLIRHISDRFLRRVWYRGSGNHTPRTPEVRVGASEASGQYVATVAMLALLVSDQMAEAELAVLYRPFTDVVPRKDLERE
jgi:hypothetical protein